MPENPIEVSNGYKCPKCDCISPTVWEAFGHLNKEHPANKKE